MLSRISIEVDFENGNMPIIQIMQQDSDDVRDKLVAVFLQSLGHTSRWATVEYQNRIDDKDGFRHRWIVRPVTVGQLKTESRLMAAFVKSARPVEPIEPPQALGTNAEKAEWANPPATALPDMENLF